MKASPQKAAVQSPPPSPAGLGREADQGWGKGAAQPREPHATTLLAHSRALRHDSTPAERKLWQALRGHHLAGLKLRRQVPMGPYIADFSCAEARLVVELDGVSHLDSVETDSRRDAWMRANGPRVVRFTNSDVLGNLEGVVTAIGEFARTPPPPISLPQGEGESGTNLHPAPSHV